jgi:hypothetical protein
VLKVKNIDKIICAIKNKAEDTEFITQHKRRKQDFTRKQKLTPTDVIYFILGKTGNPMDFETLTFCETMNKKIQPPAICKARDKIKYTAFEELFHHSTNTIELKNFYHNNYRITSFDGIQGELPKTPELMTKYKPSKTAQYPMFHAIAEYDVLNCIYTNALFAPSPADERDLVYQLLEKHAYKGKEIFLFDRGFPSIKLIQLLEKQGKKYVMRVSTSFLREVNDFGNGSLQDALIHVNYDKRRKLQHRVDFEGESYCFDLRCVKIDLPKGQTEVLITNLDKEEFSRLDIGELYGFRWRVETAFLDLKYAVHVEEFVSKKENSLKQEFFASLIQANLSMLFVDAANQVLLLDDEKKLV